MANERRCLSLDSNASLSVSKIHVFSYSAWHILQAATDTSRCQTHSPCPIFTTTSPGSLGLYLSESRWFAWLASRPMWEGETKGKKRKLAFS